MMSLDLLSFGYLDFQWRDKNLLRFCFKKKKKINQSLLGLTWGWLNDDTLLKIIFT